MSEPQFTPMPLQKRAFDLTLLLLTAPVTVPLFVGAAVILWIRTGSPIFYSTFRQGQDSKPFRLWKFRTLPDSSKPSEPQVSTAYEAGHLDGFRQWLRRSRLDELPQLWNILRGDMTWVGPRPPDLRYATKYPDLYDRVLLSRPGLTGLATLVMFQKETAILARAASSVLREKTYERHLIPRKARLDLTYQRRQSDPWIVVFDIIILTWTARDLMTSIWPAKRSFSAMTNRPVKSLRAS